MSVAIITSASSGLGLILRAFTTAAAFFVLSLKFTYLLAGTISTNPLLIILAFIILVAGFNAGKIGLDHWSFRSCVKNYTF